MIDHLTFHEKFSPQEFEQQYNLRLGRPDYEQTVIPGWLKDSESARENLDCKIDIRYGDGEKQKLDVFSCADSTAATLLYFHGGYWQRGDKSIYSFIASPFVAAGVNVVVIGYDLCPQITLTKITDQAREALAYVYLQSDALGINKDRLSVMGHSAGGHITEMMMGTHWPAFNNRLPVDLIKAGIPVSPLSLLEPVRRTEGLNTGIQMDEAEAESQSPMLNHPPVTNAPQLVVVGGSETDEFHRQALMYYEAFNTADRTMELYHVPDVDHFDELNVLVNPSSPFFKKTLALVNL